MITVISAYRVSQSNLTLGKDTTYNQQYRPSRCQGHLNPEPKIQFIHDLIHTVKVNKHDGEVLVMLDANTILTEKHTTKLLNHTEMYDVMGYKHTTHTPNTYLRGSKTINFILATRTLLPTIKQAGILIFKDGIQSNHRGL